MSIDPTSSIRREPIARIFVHAPNNGSLSRDTRSQLCSIDIESQLFRHLRNAISSRGKTSVFEHFHADDRASLTVEKQNFRVKIAKKFTSDVDLFCLRPLVKFTVSQSDFASKLFEETIYFQIVNCTKFLSTYLKGHKFSCRCVFHEIST